MAKMINALPKTEVIHRRYPWSNFEAVDYATLERIDWVNNRRPLEPIGNIPAAEPEAAFYAALDIGAVAASLTKVSLWQNRSGSDRWFRNLPIWKK